MRLKALRPPAWARRDYAVGVSDPNVQFAAAREAIRAGRFSEAESMLRGLDGMVPGHPLVLSLLGVALRRLGRLDEAVRVARKSAEIDPANGAVLTNYGGVLEEAGRLSEAGAAFERALSVSPGLVEARVGLSNVATRGGNPLRAAEVCREGLGLSPGDARLAANLGAALLHAGEPEEAAAVYEGALRAAPGDRRLALGAAVSLLYAEGRNAERVGRAHERAGGLVAASAGGPARLPIRDPDPERLLRIGVMCADFRAHASAFFLGPLLKGMARDRVEWVLYATGGVEDAVTHRLRGCAAALYRIDRLDPGDLTGRVRADGVDVLLDLSGYAEGQRLEVFARRAAPLQGTYLAYPSTTGVPGMDFRIVDSTTDPPGEADRWSTERLVRVDPCLLVYDPAAGLVEGAAPSPPGERGPREGPITFGSFSGMQKISRETAALWGRVLSACPGSVLLLRNHVLAGPAERAWVAERFAGAGVGPERLILEGPTPGAAATMREYASVDVALDSFPYTGTTTTCEALWMGVPMVTLAGRTSASRVSASILRAAGLGELVAEDPDAFVSIASGLAADRDRLAAWRGTLPGRMAGSPVGDGPGFAARFEGAIRGLWREACAGR